MLLESLRRLAGLESSKIEVDTTRSSQISLENDVDKLSVVVTG